MEGSGPVVGSIPPTIGDGSGSGRLKNLWILRIRIWICNTVTRGRRDISILMEAKHISFVEQVVFGESFCMQYSGRDHGIIPLPFGSFFLTSRKYQPSCGNSVGILSTHAFQLGQILQDRNRSTIRPQMSHSVSFDY
jgi:hypothetical protein